VVNFNKQYIIKTNNHEKHNHYLFIYFFYRCKRSGKKLQKASSKYTSSKISAAKENNKVQFLKR
jgi:hypothetical protein